MTRLQLLISLGGLISIFVLYQLPRVVVENEQVQEVVSGTKTHAFEIPAEIKEKMASLKRLLQEATNRDKQTTLALSLAEYYLTYNALDSAVELGDLISEWSERPSKEVADIYFLAYERAQNQDQAKQFVLKARLVLEQLLDEDPANLMLKNKLAMTLVASESPMMAIASLREILEEDVNNRQAILNLGLLSIQSGQFDRAEKRFAKLVSLNAADNEAKLYLAVSMMEINKQSQARLLLEEILASKDSIPAIKMMASDYLRGL